MTATRERLTQTSRARTFAQGAAASTPAEPAAQAIQHRIDDLRDRLLAGRGIGASPAELSAHMHQRPTLGADPTTVALEATHQQTSRALGRDTPAERRFSEQRVLAPTSRPVAVRTTQTRPPHRLRRTVLLLAIGAVTGASAHALATRQSGRARSTA